MAGLIEALRSRKQRFELVMTTASLSLVFVSLLALPSGPVTVVDEERPTAASGAIAVAAEGRATVPSVADDVLARLEVLPEPFVYMLGPEPDAAIDSCELRATSVQACAVALPSAAPAAAERDVDEMFLEARELAFIGDREGARAMAREILTRAPEYLDVSVFLARVHAWDGEFDEARVLIDGVLVEDRGYLEARKAEIDIALWSGNACDAFWLVDAALVAAPDDPELADRRDRVRRVLDANRLQSLESMPDTEVAETVPSVRESNPVDPTEHAEIILARNFDNGPRARSREPGIVVDEEAEAGQVQYRAVVEYFLDHFSKNLDDWHQVNVSLEREAKWGSVIGRIGYYNRFQDSAALFELDVYPQIRKGTYAYLNVGVSTRDILPDYRLAAEIYQALPFGLEASVGWRQVRFDFTTNTVTPSLGWYKGNYWLLVRPLISFAQGESTVSWVGRVRRYFSDPEEYVTLTFAKGRAIEGNAGSTALFLLDSIGGFAQGRKRIFDRYIAKLGLGYESQELPGRSDRGRLTFAAGIEYLF